MNNNNQPIYVIITNWDEYECNHDNIEGYVYTKEEAEQVTKELNEYYRKPHPIGVPDDSYDNPELYLRWENIHNNWMYEQGKLLDAFWTKDKCELFQINREEYLKLCDQIDDLCKTARLEWYKNNESIQDLLPEGKTWEEILELCDVYYLAKMEKYNSAEYKEISLYNKHKMK